MPPKYLTVDEAKLMNEALAREFGQLKIEVKEERNARETLKDTVSEMAVDNAERDGKIDALTKGIQDIKTMISDRTQMRMVIWISVVGWVVSIATAVWAKA